MKTSNFHRKIANINGVRLSYLDTQSDLPTILCLHGRFGSAKTWTGLINHYSENYRVIAPDQRGHGLSEKPLCKYTAEEMSADISGLISHLGCETPIVVGHSMGARVAGYLAAHFPSQVRAVALLDHSPMAGRTKPTSKPLDQIPLVDAFTKNWPSSFATIADAEKHLSNIVSSKVLIDYFMESLTESTNGWRMAFSQQATSAIFEYQHSWEALLPMLQCPALLVRAKNSSEVSNQDWLEMQLKITKQTNHEVSSPDHHVYLSNSSEFYERLSDWLTSLEL